MSVHSLLVKLRKSRHVYLALAALPALMLSAPLWADDGAGEDTGDGFRETDEIAVPHNDGSGIMHYDVEPTPHAPKLPYKIQPAPQKVRHMPTIIDRRGVHKPRRNRGSHHVNGAKKTGPKVQRKGTVLSGHPMPGNYGKYHVAGPRPYPYKHYPFGRPDTHPQGSGRRF